MKDITIKSHENGAHHWRHQRLTAVMMLFLIPYGLFAFVKLYDQSFDNVLLWFKNPLHVTLITGMLWIMIYHSYLGLKIIVDDYIHCCYMKKITSFVVLTLHMFAALFTLFIFVLR